MSAPTNRMRTLQRAAIAVALLAGAAPAAAQDGPTIASRYADVANRAAVMTTKSAEAPKALQARAVLTLRRAQALSRSLSLVAPGAFPACETSLGAYAAGSRGVSRGAALIRSARTRFSGATRKAKVRQGRARIGTGIARLNTGLVEAGVCWAQIYARTIQLPAPPVDTPDGQGPPPPPR
jgi:hypothetical protein